MLSNSPNIASPLEETDPPPRSTKKSKWKITNLIFNHDPPTASVPLQHPITERQPPPNPATQIPPKPTSFRDMLTSGKMQGFISHPMCLEDDEANLSDDDEMPVDMIDDPKCPIILLSKEEKKRLRQPWKHALIIKMFNGKIGYMSLIKRLKRKWELKGGLTLTDIGHEYFIARFSLLEDYNHVISQGPWMLDDNYLTIRKWVPNFIPDDLPMRYLTAWVRIPNLSVEYFDKDFLKRLGSKIGKVTRIDHNTALAQRGQFTRLSVELDLTKPLLSKFWLRGKVWKIQYEGLRMICFKCGKIGHQEERCVDGGEPTLNDSTEMNVESSIEAHDIQVPLSPQLDQDFGSWMMVKKPPPRRRPVRGDKEPPDNPRSKQTRDPQPVANKLLPAQKNGGSRFEILGNEAETAEANKGENIQAIAPPSLGNSILEGDITDLGKSSQNNEQPIPVISFNLGYSKNSNPGGSNLGKAKTWQKVQPKPKSATKKVLQNITNVLPIDTPTTPVPTVDLGKENTTPFLQPNTTAQPKLPLPSLQEDINLPDLVPEATDYEPFYPSTDLPINPPREDNWSLPPDGGAIPMHHRSSESQSGGGDPFLDDRFMAEAGVDDHVEATQ